MCCSLRSEIRKIPNIFCNNVRIVILSFLQLSAIYVIVVWGDPAWGDPSCTGRGGGGAGLYMTLMHFNSDVQDLKKIKHEIFRF